jgi:hypothetical protein
MIVVGGVVPLAWTLVFFLRGAIVAIPKGTAEGFYMLAILLAHLLVIGGALYVLSAVVGRLLRWTLRHRTALIVAGLFTIDGAVASWFDIYHIPGHNSAPPANLLRLLAERSTRVKAACASLPYR